MRLDLAVAAKFGISRRKAREHISAGRVQVNRRRVAVSSREVAERDQITLIPEQTVSLKVLKEHEDWIAFDKPAGMPTQPARDRKHLSLEDLARSEYRSIYVVHRLDTPTSGVVIFARNRESAARLSELFASGEMKKTYLAVAEGAIERELKIETPVRDRAAATIVRPVRQSPYGTVVEVDILTGRTHQIRIHLASIGAPVAGDRRYGSTINAPRLMLHAWRLEHAGVGRIEAPIPPEFV
ncbi:MAG TPA: RluA family pseudouridine synthase [Thermoanaerobaculia bacterium]